jgi:multiple sugar transport system ATP-binding protein
MPSVMHAKIGDQGEITHDQVDAMTLGDRLVVMKDGWIRQVGMSPDIDNRPAVRIAGLSPSRNSSARNC